MLKWTLRHAMVDLGFLPTFILDSDPRPAAQQINERYVFGGWRPLNGWTMFPSDGLQFPGDPVMYPLAETRLRDERILLYPSDWVVIVQPDGSFEAARID